ncbi:transmembrane protein, putative (macronuclear) [Tetrahymena thermophila SB210]|uniref:Transmembrane protein, putative n=1 Tax=Tetrahymena thermophila (strain SB210) TaxID=312017 RepID=W7X7X0_TETTS|nr:transmembrane protein, putative [Tetrahymena thermophila SB210]EWS73432.1 transmembrane protein, putative [Tetrahymena thermophila SB210]|eukprot:XP_012654048.1 transmembrane protein, putative [Tetrahymena thermophila SB210]
MLIINKKQIFILSTKILILFHASIYQQIILIISIIFHNNQQKNQLTNQKTIYQFSFSQNVIIMILKYSKKLNCKSSILRNLKKVFFLITQLNQNNNLLIQYIATTFLLNYKLLFYLILNKNLQKINQTNNLFVAIARRPSCFLKCSYVLIIIFPNLQTKIQYLFLKFYSICIIIVFILQSIIFISWHSFIIFYFHFKYFTCQFACLRKACFYFLHSKYYQVSINF